jgi:hypothetical protein
MGPLRLFGQGTAVQPLCTQLSIIDVFWTDLRRNGCFVAVR